MTRSPSLDGLGAQKRSSPLSLAKTGAKSVDWSGGRGDITRTTPHTVEESHWSKDSNLAHITPIGREPPRGSALNSTHRGRYGVGLRKRGEGVLLLLLSLLFKMSDIKI